MRELAYAIKEYAEQNDLVNYIETDRQFHGEMLALSGDPLLAQYVERPARACAPAGIADEGPPPI